MYTISICLFILKLHTSTAQFPAHVDLQKVGEIIFNNEKFNVLKPTTHIVTDYFKEFMLRRQNKHHSTKRVFIDDNGFRHSWSGYEDKIESLRKTGVKIEDNNEDAAKNNVVNKDTNDGSQENNDDKEENNDSPTNDNDDNVNNDKPTENIDNTDSPTRDKDDNENEDSPTDDNDDNENNDTLTEKNDDNENNDTPTEKNDDNGNKDGTNTDVTEAVSEKATAHWSYYEPIKKVDTNSKKDETAMATNKQVTTTSNKEGQGARKSIRKSNTGGEGGKTLATITFFCPFFGLMNMSAFVD